MSPSQASVGKSIPVREYVQQAFVPLSRLAHDWELHSAVALSPSEERTMVREPARAIPQAISRRLGKLRILLVPFVACYPTGDMVAFSNPEGEKHSAVWMENRSRIDLVLACRDLDPHDTGWEFLASVAELLRSRLTSEEMERYTTLLQEELGQGFEGEIDEDAYEAKQPLRRRSRWSRTGPQFLKYRDVSFTSTCAEYVHGLWHDVQIRLGREHLPLPVLRRRMILMAEMFPPNPGYELFAESEQA
ncbi:MAG TPA: hypothetical protein VNM47_07635 [Terriglobia bacterium]|nr:hypothetical protein [Terriglobia bacterium]